MDQNRLLDVINDPELLQSFLDTPTTELPSVNISSEQQPPPVTSNPSINTLQPTPSISSSPTTPLSTTHVTSTPATNEPPSNQVTIKQESPAVTFSAPSSSLEPAPLSTLPPTEPTPSPVSAIHTIPTSPVPTENVTTTPATELPSAHISIKQEPPATTVTSTASNSSFQPTLSFSATTPSTPISSNVTTTPTSTATKTTAPTPKKTPKPRAKQPAKGKNNKAANTPTASNSPSTPGVQSSATPTNHVTTTMQPQFTNSHQQQILFQTNNVRMRQPAPMTSSPMCQLSIGGIPQQQRVIQIPTANGPMYFAIAPGPAMNNNPMMNQQPGIQSQQYPSQQICFQPNSTVMINRPHLAQSPQQQQQQQQQQHTPQQQQQQQTRTPDRPGQYTPDMQQSRPCLTSPQMMVPRMSNQLILNRPLNSPGQLLPGQQQFIQIQTPNGPMLLALPTQPAQPVNNTMIDFNKHVQNQQTIKTENVNTDTNLTMSPSKQTNTGVSKTVSNTKPGLDLADLLLDCGILPEERMAASQSPMITMASSPSTPIKTETNPTTDNKKPATKRSRSKKSDVDKFPILKTPKIAQQQQQQQQQQKMQAVTVVPMTVLVGDQNKAVLGGSEGVKSNVAQIAGGQQVSLAKIVTPVMQTSSLRPLVNSNMMQTSIPQANLLVSSIGQNQVSANSAQNTQLASNTVMQTASLVNSNMMQAGIPQGNLLVTSLGQNQTSTSSGQNTQLASNSVIQTASLQSLVSSNMIQTSIPQANLLVTQIRQNQSGSDSGQNTQLASDSGDSISASSITVQNSNSLVGSTLTTQTLTTSSTSQMSSSGNVPTNSLQRIDKSGTVESNPHISSSLMPTISLTVDTLKIDQNGLKTLDGQSQMTSIVKGIQTTNGVATLVLQPTQAQSNQNAQNNFNRVQQQVTRQIDLRAQSILNQLAADQNAALNQQIKQSFESIEDACKRLLRYHVFDTQTVSEAQIKKVDEIFEAAAESLIIRKQAIYDKYRFLILKQSMKTVPSSEEVMLDQMFVQDEHSFLKKERELFREYEAHLESIALEQARAESNKDGSAPDYFAFGEHSPKQNNQDHDLDNAAQTDDWLLTDKWSKSSYPSVPDSEAATAIESILNEELS